VDADGYRFDHVLVRESVYDALLKRVRASLHERFVTWADRVNGDRAVEFEEILGYHLEQAYRHLVELAPADEHALAVGRDGAGRLAAAGRRALERGDMPAASSLLLRATALLPPLDSGRLRLFPDLGEALMQIGEVAQAESLLDDAIATAELAGARAPAAVASLVRTLLRRLSTTDESWTERAMEAARTAIDACDEAGDDAGLSRAWRLVGSVEAGACRLAEAADALDRALAHARAADDVRQERRGSTAYAIVLAYGPTPVGEALARCEAMAERVRGDRQSEAALLCVSGHLLALQGAFEDGRARMRSSRRRFEELGLRVDAAMMCMQESHVEALAGDAAAAEAVLRRGYVVLDELGDRFWLPSVAGLLAQALIAQGRLDEADEPARLAEERARADDVDAQSQWRCARAKILALSGEPRRAATLAREAVELLEPTDAVLVQVAALADLSAVLAADGRQQDALAPLERAIRLARAKASPALVARLQAARPALLDEPLASRTR
jgi:tetratricopeptide (TPR) repeat protein